MKRFLITAAILSSCLSAGAGNPIKTKDILGRDASGAMTLDREIVVRKARELDSHPVSSYSVDLGMQAENTDFFVPGQLYGPLEDTQRVLEAKTLPVVMARDRISGKTITVIRTDCNGSEGQLKATDGAITFSFPIREKKSGFSLMIEEYSTGSFTEAVMDAWEAAYQECAPDYEYVDQEELYKKLALKSEDGAATEVDEAAVLERAEWFLKNRRGTACTKPWEYLETYLIAHSITLDSKWLEAASEAAGFAETYLWTGIADEALARLSYDFHRLFVLTQNGHFRDVALRIANEVAPDSPAHLSSMTKFMNEFGTPDIYVADRLVLQWFD